MKKLTILLTIALSSCLYSRTTLTTQPNRVLYSSEEINQVSTTDSIRKIHPGTFSLARNMKLVLTNGERRTVAKKDIWGYSDKKGNVWRRFRNDYYQVIQVSDVVEYRIVERRGKINAPVRKYSKTLDSKIVGSRKRALRSDDVVKTK